MWHTLLSSTLATATFVCALAFTPAIASVGERLSYGQAQLARMVVLNPDRDCWSSCGRTRH